MSGPSFTSKPMCAGNIISEIHESLKSVPFNTRNCAFREKYLRNLVFSVGN